MHWRSCYQGFYCVRLSVLFDYDKEDLGYIAVALILLPGNDADKHGHQVPLMIDLEGLEDRVLIVFARQVMTENPSPAAVQSRASIQEKLAKVFQRSTVLSWPMAV